MKTKNKIDRREFLKRLGAGAAVTAAALATGCGSKKTTTAAQNEVPDAEEMTYRTNPTSGDRVSLLGFGMMRLPMVAAREGGKGDEVIDQPMVNELVDYALAHGVNYFDTSPAYCRGLSERATGTALKRLSLIHI